MRQPIYNDSVPTPSTRRILEGVSNAVAQTPKVQEGDRVVLSGTSIMGRVVRVAQNALTNMSQVECDYNQGMYWVPTQRLVVANHIVPASTVGFQRIAFDVYRNDRYGPDYGSIWRKESIDGKDYLVVHTDDNEENRLIRGAVLESLQAEAQGYPRGGDSGGEGTQTDNVPPRGWNVEKKEPTEDDLPPSVLDDEEGRGGGDNLTMAIEEALNEAGAIEPVDGGGAAGGGVHLDPDMIRSVTVELTEDGEPSAFEMTPEAPAPGGAAGEPTAPATPQAAPTGPGEKPQGLEELPEEVAVSF